MRFIDRYQISPMNNYLSIITVTKCYSAEQLVEWFLWHKFIGVDHFYLVDDGGPIRVQKVLEDYGDCITFIDSKNLNKVWTPLTTSKLVEPKRERLGFKPSMYVDLYDTYKDESSWIAFIDDDEFIFPTKNESLKSFLAGIENHDALFLQWRNFNPQGKVKTPLQGLTFDNYKYYEDSRTVKSIVNCQRVKRVLCKNHFLASKGVDSSGKSVHLNSQTLDHLVKDPCFILNHYSVRSFQDAKSKLNRGYEAIITHHSDEVQFKCEKLLKLLICYSNPDFFNSKTFNFQNDHKQLRSKFVGFLSDVNSKIKQNLNFGEFCYSVNQDKSNRKVIYQVDLYPQGDKDRPFFYDATVNYTMESVKRYAERIGADYFCIKEMPSKLQDVIMEHYGKSCLAKMYVFEHFLNTGYDKMMILDCDMLARDCAPDVFEENPFTEKDLIFSTLCGKNNNKHIKVMKDVYNYEIKQFYNGGIYLANRKGAKNIFKYLSIDLHTLLNKNKFLNNRLHDQHLVGYLVEKNNLNIGIINGWKWNRNWSSTAEFKSNAFNGKWVPFEKSHFVHYASQGKSKMVEDYETFKHDNKS